MRRRRPFTPGWLMAALLLPTDSGSLAQRPPPHLFMVLVDECAPPQPQHPHTPP